MPKKQRAYLPAIAAIAILALIVLVLAFSGHWNPIGYDVLPAGTTVVATPFAVDAWNANWGAWTDCTSLGMNKAALDAFCTCKGYGAAAKCWFEFVSQRYKLGSTASAPACIAKGNGTNSGTALTKVACTPVLSDLIETEYVLSQTHPFVNDIETITVYIKNNGTAVPKYEDLIKATLQNVGDGGLVLSASSQDYANHIVPGTYAYFVFTDVHISKQNNRFIFTIDPYNQISEINKKNNVFNFDIKAIEGDVVTTNDLWNKCTPTVSSNLACDKTCENINKHCLFGTSRTDGDFNLINCTFIPTAPQGKTLIRTCLCCP